MCNNTPNCYHFHNRRKSFPKIQTFSLIKPFGHKSSFKPFYLSTRLVFNLINPLAAYGFSTRG
ncbi:hypothetical protein Hanom_Chr06g00571341 [Helianthus anomalus]